MRGWTWVRGWGKGWASIFVMKLGKEADNGMCRDVGRGLSMEAVDEVEIGFEVAWIGVALRR
jgi:hypothetical protein